MDGFAHRPINPDVSSGAGPIAAAAVTLSFVLICTALVFWRLRRREPADGQVPAFAGGLGLSSVTLTPRAAAGVSARSNDSGGVEEVRARPTASAGEPTRATGKPELAHRLEPAARLLGASGVIVWNCSPDGRQLEIVAAYGDSDAFLGRIAPIELGAAVLTSVAFVEGRTRIRGRNNSRLAAIAVPIERDRVRLGVLTAEIDSSRSDRVSDDSAALMQLLASQMSGSLAALSPLAARAAAAAKARGPSARPLTEVLPAYESAAGLPSVLEAPVSPPEPSPRSVTTGAVAATLTPPAGVDSPASSLPDDRAAPPVASFAPIEVTVRVDTPERPQISEDE